ncbi:MAG TPA: hypothetical protein VMU77_00755, partial [Acidimicrobiales bacterium]|nr:hypothetical protein [Acidimicrobiales bacterium]
MTAPGMFGAGMLGLGLPIPVIGNPISSAAGSVASGVLGFGAQGIMGTLTQWVAGGAVWFLDRLGGAMGATTSPDLGARWFTTHFHLMATIAAMVALPVALVSIIQAIARQDSSILIRCLLVNLPLALLATGVVAEAIQFAIGLTDQLCNAVSSGAGNQMKSLFTSMEQWLLSPTANFAGPGVPAFVMFILAGVVAFGALVLWIEMILRSAAVYVAVLFLPLVLIGIVSPVSAPWCKRA